MKIGNLECYGIIYKIENIVNHKVYIGQTTRGFKNRYAGNNKTKPIEWVYNYHKSISKHRTYNKYLINSIEKYGFDAFKVNEIFDIAFSEKELNIKEKCWISIYRSNDRRYGFNFTNGGDSFKPSNDSKIYDGIKILCINNGKIYKSYTEAIEYFRKYNIKLTIKYIKESFNKKTTKLKKYNKPIFKLYTDDLKDFKYCQKCGRKFKIHKYDPPNTNRKYCYMCSPSRVKNKTKKKKKYKNRNKNIISKTTNLINKEKINKLCSKYEQYICDEYIKNMDFSNIINNINIDFQVNNEIIKCILNKNNILIIPQKYNVNYINYNALYYNDTLLEVFRYKWQLIDYLVKNKICTNNNIANNLIASKRDKQYFNNGFYIKTINKDYFNSNYCLYKNKNDKYEIEYRKRLKLDLK